METRFRFDTVGFESSCEGGGRAPPPAPPSRPLGIVAPGPWASTPVRRPPSAAARARDLGSLEWDLTTGDVSWNEGAQQMWGFAPGEFRGRLEQIDGRVHPDDRSKVRGEWVTAVAAGRVFDHEFRVVWPDGTERRLAARGRAWRDPKGEPAKVKVVVIDVTERRGRIAPPPGGERLRLALMGARGAMFGQGLDLRYTWACGVDAGATDRLLGKTDAELFPPADARRLTELKRAVLASGVGARSELRLSCAGPRRRYELTVEPERDPDGRVVGLVWATWGASAGESQRTEERRLLAELGSELVASNDYDHTIALVARFVARELSDWCVVDVLAGPDTPARREIARNGPARAPAVGDPAPAPEAPPDVVRDEAPTLPDVPPCNDAEPLGPPSDGGLPRALAKLGVHAYLAVPLAARGRTLGTLVLGSDDPTRRYGFGDLRVAERVARHAALAIDNARLALVTRRELEVRDNALATVAHELRGPLNTIGLHAQLLEQQAPGARAAGVADALAAITRATERASRLLQDLLDARRVGRGPLVIERTRLDPKPFVLEAIRALRGAASASSVVVVGQFEGTTPPLWADRDRLSQALENLLGNAIKFTPPGGRVTVSVAAYGGEAVFRVADTGCGLAPENLPRVFEPFWQARHDDQRGVGLGLALCKAIVEAHGGRIWAESQPGVGATFLFTIPLGP